MGIFFVISFEIFRVKTEGRGERERESLIVVN